MRASMRCALGALGLVVGVVVALPAQEIAPCVAITGVDSTQADKCIPVPVTPPVVTPPDTVVTPPSDTALWARAMGLWSPTRPGDCTKAQHDAYSAIGPDGKRYPVWHPPVGEDGCHFGHEHGDNPALSPLDSLGPVLFGYVNEQAHAGPYVHRHEDHVGHKVFAANNFVFSPTGAALEKVPLAPFTCDVLTKFHQGTHSPDAFTNNLHEQITRVYCTNGFAFEVQLLSAVGKAGTLTKQCSPQEVIVTGPATPGDSPTLPPVPRQSMGHRFLPTDACVEIPRPNVFEVWKTQNIILGPDGSRAVRFAWYWSVSNPPRYWSPTGIRRTVDQCYRVVAGAYQAISNPCLTLRNEGTGVPVTWDSEASPFKGTIRSVKLNDFQMHNAEGAEVFYTDALGINASLTPFPGSVRQYVRNGIYPYPLNGKGSHAGNFDASGVRAPN